MQVTIKLFNSSGCELDSQEITVRGEEDGITLTKIADSIGWTLADGDTIRIQTEEGA